MVAEAINVWNKQSFPVTLYWLISRPSAVINTACPFERDQGPSVQWANNMDVCIMLLTDVR